MILMLTTTISGQQYSTNSRKAIKWFEDAVSHFRALDDEQAEQSLLKALKADDEFIEAYQLLSQVCYDQGRTEEAISHYSKSLELDPDGNPDGYRLLAGLTIMTGDYDRTLGLIDKFLSFPAHLTRSREIGLMLKKKCEFAIEAMKTPVPFNPRNLGDSVNSGYNEYWPSLSVDEKMLIFTVMIPRDPELGLTSGNIHEDFFYSKKIGDKWSSRQNAGTPLNTPGNEGAHTMTADGRCLYFTACNRRDGKGKCDIYISRMVDGKWSKPVNIGTHVNSPYSEKHPSISADGRVLFFTSDRPGGEGSYDIWYSVKSGDHWGEPINLGDSVNTSGLEQSPFIHPDQQSLYFSSDGWPGMGQGDLFYSRLKADRTWSKPVNLGYPINTYNDEIGLTVNARGNLAYFASDRGAGTDTDLYSFELPPAVKPVMVSYLTGRVFDSRNMRGIAAEIELIDLESEETVMKIESSQGEGDYLISLPTGRDYALNVSAEGYLFYSVNFSFSGEHSIKEPYRQDIPLERIIAGSSIVLNNIFFETDSHELLPESLVELNKVLDFMLQNPSVVVEIAGHTDSTGTALHNQELSELRAREVVDFLIEGGIVSERLKPVGYGDTRPVADNISEAGRGRNRRTELKIVRLGKDLDNKNVQ